MGGCLGGLDCLEQSTGGPCKSLPLRGRADRIFGDRRRLFATSTRPSGRAVVTEDGFRVSGRWSLVSGCELADWIPVMCVITEGKRHAAGGGHAQDADGLPTEGLVTHSGHLACRRAAGHRQPRCRGR